MPPLLEAESNHLDGRVVLLVGEARAGAPGPIGWQLCSSRRLLSVCAVPQEPSVAEGLCGCHGNSTPVN